MKKLTLVLLLVTAFSYSQERSKEKIKEYTASNGITYKKGDSIILGKATNGKTYKNITLGGYWVYNTGGQDYLPAEKEGVSVEIKKITKYNYKRYQAILVTVKGDELTKWAIDLEKAIETKEIEAP